MLIMKNLLMVFGLVVGMFVAAPVAVAQFEDPLDLAQLAADYAKIDCNIMNAAKNEALYDCDNQRDGYTGRSSIEYMILMAKIKMYDSNQFTAAEVIAWEEARLAELAILDTERTRIFNEDDDPVSYEHAGAQELYDLAFWYPWYYSDEDRIAFFNDARDLWAGAELAWESAKTQYEDLGLVYGLLYSEAYVQAVTYGYIGSP
jgi:hypothetical protein